jgi:hypothetical protein
MLTQTFLSVQTLVQVGLVTGFFWAQWFTFFSNIRLIPETSLSLFWYLFSLTYSGSKERNDILCSWMQWEHPLTIRVGKSRASHHHGHTINPN